MHGVMVLLCNGGNRPVMATAAAESAPRHHPPRNLIATDGAHLSSSGCRLSGHDESPDAVRGRREVVRVGRADIQLAMSPGGHVPSSFGRPYHSDCAVQRQAWRVQARPKGVEPALSLCAYGWCLNKNRVLPVAPVVVQMCVPQPRRYHLLQVAPLTRSGAGCHFVTNDCCASQAKGKHRRSVCLPACLSYSSAEACDAAPGCK